MSLSSLLGAVAVGDATAVTGLEGGTLETKGMVTDTVDFGVAVVDVVGAVVVVAGALVAGVLVGADVSAVVGAAVVAVVLDSATLLAAIVTRTSGSTT